MRMSVVYVCIISLKSGFESSFIALLVWYPLLLVQQGRDVVDVFALLLPGPQAISAIRDVFRVLRVQTTL
jgi:hypothetical protein